MLKELLIENWPIYCLLDKEIMRAIKIYANEELIDVGYGDKQYYS